MEVGKCYAVVKGTVHRLDRGVVFPGSLQHWIRMKRAQRPDGLRSLPVPLKGFSNMWTMTNV